MEIIPAIDVRGGRCEALEYLDCQNNESLGKFWAELAANGETTAYSDMNSEDLAEAWKKRWPSSGGTHRRPATVLPQHQRTRINIQPSPPGHPPSQTLAPVKN